MVEIIETTDFNLLAELSEEIHTLHHHLYPHIFKPYNKTDIAESFKTTFSYGGVNAFVAMQDGKAVGYIFTSLNHRKEDAYFYERKSLMIDQILVLSTSRKSGVGKLLLERVSTLARELKIKRVELNHWTDNASAGRFFSKNGFAYFNQKMFLVVQ